MRIIDVVVQASKMSAKVFKVLREFDPTLELGPTLAKLRSGERVLSVESDCSEARNILASLIRLLDALQSLSIPYSLSITEAGPVPIANGPGPIWPSTTATREDLAKALDFENSIAVTTIPDRVWEVIKTLNDSKWFRSVGKPINDPSVIVGNLEDAQAQNDWFDYAILEYRNALSSSLCYNFHYHYNRRWNPFAKLLKPELDALLGNQLSNALIPVSAELALTLRSLVMSACFERFFSEQVPTSAPSEWVHWITRGHIPYGWNGRFPEGKLVVV